jgi:hypothetical protein
MENTFDKGNFSWDSLIELQLGDERWFFGWASERRFIVGDEKRAMFPIQNLKEYVWLRNNSKESMSFH